MPDNKSLYKLSTACEIDVYGFNVDNINNIEDVKELLSCIEWCYQSFLCNLPDKFKKNTGKKNIYLDSYSKPIWIKEQNHDNQIL